MAQTIAGVNINLNFAPVVDVNVNPNNPVIGGIERSFSADPN
jgi:beta-N-acetylhexosaminidase